VLVCETLHFSSQHLDNLHSIEPCGEYRGRKRETVILMKMRLRSAMGMYVFWMMATITFFVDSSKEAVMLEISSLLRSDSRSHFASDQMFFDAHDALFTKIISYSNTSAEHPFVISLFQDCRTCHDTLIHAGNFTERYRVISAMKAIFYGTIVEIEELKGHYPHSINYYVPLLPGAKIDISLRTMTNKPSSQGGCSDIIFSPAPAASLNVSNTKRGSISMTASAIKLTIVVAPLSAVDLKTFILNLKLMQTNKKINIKFTINTSELKQDEERSAHITINNGENSCENVLKLSLLLSEKREVLWIERSHEIRTNNKWAKGICQSGVYTDTPAYASNLTGKNDILIIIVYFIYFYCVKF
jgi:hypothetical protein